MNVYVIILTLSLVIIVAYLIDITCKQFKIPSVFFLIGLGFALRIIADSWNFSIPYLFKIVPMLGTFGLIMIVLEGSLDLEFKKENFKVLKKSAISAIVLLLLNCIGIAILFDKFYTDKFYICFVNAIPLALISSAIAISSVWKRKAEIREFVVYESSLTDVFGVMVYNFFIINTVIDVLAFAGFLMDMALIIIISILITFFLSKLLNKLTHHVKYLPILSMLFVVYSIAELIDLAPLILILMFGLFLNNSDYFITPRISKYISNTQLKLELPNFRIIVHESTFVFRTLFFIIFGFSTTVPELLDLRAITISLLIVLIIFSLRFVFIKFVLKMKFMPVGFVAPRGLITILLAIKIPEILQIKNFNNGILIWTVLISVFVMFAAFLFYREKSPENPGTFF